MTATKDEFQSINHCLFKGILVLFILPKELDRDQFGRSVGLLQQHAQVAVTDDHIAAYWNALLERMSGASRWDKVSPMVTEGSDPEWLRRAFLSQNNVDNIPQKRPYVAFSISGIRYVLDVFNPRNELEIQYPGAGEPVLALVMQEEEYGNVGARLVENVAFYAIVRGLASTCQAKQILGMNSGDLASMMRAYHERNISVSTDPWSFLFPIQVMKLPRAIGTVSLARYFKKTEDWEDDRLLLQVKNGIDFTINRHNADAAKMLGMVPVQDLNPDMLKNRQL
jgi:hypothetical protein